jgi:hypothetical protein
MLGDDLVAQLTGPVKSPPSVLFDKVENLVLDASVGDIQTFSQLFLHCRNGAPTLALDQAGSPLGMADRLKFYLAEPEHAPIVSIDYTDIRGAYLKSISINSEKATPLVESCFADCDDSGRLNILDFVCYQNLFLSGNLDADCDGNNVLNILDFVCYQNAFKEGCP